MGSEECTYDLKPYSLLLGLQVSTHLPQMMRQLLCNILLRSVLFPLLLMHQLGIATLEVFSLVAALMITSQSTMESNFLDTDQISAHWESMITGLCEIAGDPIGERMVTSNC